MTSIALLALGASTAHSEPITVELTSCDTKEQMIAYTTETWLNKRHYKEVLAEMNKDGEVCNLSIVGFEPVEITEAFTHDGIRYEIVEITTLYRMVPLGGGVSEIQPYQGTRYAMRYFKEQKVGTDA